MWLPHKPRSCWRRQRQLLVRDQQARRRFEGHHVAVHVPQARLREDPHRACVFPSATVSGCSGAEWLRGCQHAGGCCSTVAPVIMTPRMIGAATVSARPRASLAGGSAHVDFATLGRAPLRLGFGSRRVTSRDLQIVEATEELLQEDVPEPEGVAENVSLLRGFNATIPSAEKSRMRRRQTRNVETPRLGLKRMSLGARGLLGDEEDQDGESVASEEDMVMVGRSEQNGRRKKAKGKRRGRQSLSAGKTFGTDELVRQTHEIERDKENLHVRRVRRLSLRFSVYADTTS